MSKTIKIIDLLNKIANDESYRPTVKYQEMTYTYQWDIGDYTNDFNSEYGIFSDWALNLMLNNEAEIIEEQEDIDIQSIEEIELAMNGNAYVIDNKTWTLNQVIKAVKQLEKKIKEKE